MTAVALLAAAGTTARAQDTTDESRSRIEEAERVMPRERPPAEPVSPSVEPEVRTPRPGLTGGHAWPDELTDEDSPVATRLPEGTTLVRRPGEVLTLPTGHRVFVVDRDARRAGEGPMLIFPSRVLASLDASLDGSSSAPVLLSGYVYEYDGRNYLLPTAFSRDTLPPIAEPEPASESVTESLTGEPEGASEIEIASAFDDPDVASLLDELDSSPAIRAVAPPAAQRSDDAASESSVVASTEAYVADGTPITRRRARLVRGPGGAWAFRFDNDFDTAGNPLLDQPMTVLPCRLLQRLESLALSQGEGVELIVSGRVYTYGQRSYILPTIYQRPLKLGIDPIQ
ncbi:MAG: hypothetical protein RIB60_03400 [Phycisphaerales bacterium]